MKNVALQNLINRDLFKDSTMSKEEMCRRLTILVEQLYQCLQQISGEQLINVNVTYYEDQQKPDPTDPNNSTLKSQVGYMFNIAGEPVQVSFTRGRLNNAPM